MARFIMAGRFQAIGFVIVFALLPLLGLFSNAAIALVALRKGWQEGLLLALIGSIAVAIFTYIEQHNFTFGFLLACIQWMPIILFAWILSQTISWETTLQALLGLSVVVVVVLHIIIPDPSVFWLELLSSTMNNAEVSAENKESLKVLEQGFAEITPLLAGIVVALSSLMIAVALLMARNWQAQLYNPGGFGEEFRELRIGKPAALISLLLVVIAFVTKTHIVLELLICSVAIFLFQGIALIHALVKLHNMHQLWLVAMYLLLVLLNTQMAIMLAAVGIIDSFADFRQRFIKQ
ncbi:MAG TPA: DUF2232 domain-containing protein [Thiothrix sp.]|nr:DUF2232 domain-containing protein [Thiothrix sp.]